MKPLKLTVQGINSFLSEQTVDFEQLSTAGMFCIVGPTGSGKTTVLDSVIIALYAPHEHNRGNMRDYINSKCDRGSITLDFEVDKVRYRVKREFRKNKNSPSSAKLENLDTGEVIADRPETVNESIQSMLKLSKDDFTKVVILEQGKFAEFMNSRPKERFDTVKTLFNLERFEKLKDTVYKAKNKYEKLLDENRVALEQYDGITEEKFKLLKKQMRELKKERENLSKESAELDLKLKGLERARDAFELVKSARATISESDAEIAKAAVDRKAVEEGEKAIAALTKKLAELKKSSDAAHATLSLVKECRDDGEKALKLRGEVEALRVKYKSAKDGIARIKGEINALNGEKAQNEAKCTSIMRDVLALGYEVIEPTEADFVAAQSTAKADYARISDAEKKRAEANKKIEACDRLAGMLIKGESELAAKIEESKKAHAIALEAYEHARLNKAAAAVREGIKDGDECPVCGGIYREGKHAAVSDDELSALKEAAVNAEQSLSLYESKSNENKIAQSSNDAEMRTARTVLRECDEIIGTRNSSDVKRAEELSEEGTKAAKKLADAEKKLSELSAKLTSEEKEADGIEKEGKRVAGEIESLSKRIEERLKGQSPENAEAAANTAIKAYDDAKKETDEASEKFGAERVRIETSEAAARAKRDAAQKTVDEFGGTQFDKTAYDKLTERADEIAEQINIKAKEYGGAEKESETVQRGLEIKKQLTEDRRNLSKRAELIANLNKCVERDKLFSFVAESRIQSFTSSASDIIRQLTQGKFSLLYEEGNFFVEDFFADNERRKVRTLSGGETFLASMSLAIAISRSLASQNYEFFFLDEGFGTLDEQMLNTVTAALRELSRETVVGVVTHRSEIAEVTAAQLKVKPATEDEGSKVEILGV